MTTRISTSQIFQNAQANVSAAREKETITAEKAATNKEITRPSQDPAGWLTASALKDSLSARDTMAKNAALAQHVLNTGDTLLSQVQDAVQRARELALSASGTGPAAETTRKAVLGEVKGLYDNVLQTLNTRYADRTLMAGFKTKGQAFDGQGNYVGDSGVIQVEIAPDVKVPVNIPAGRAILGEGRPGGVNVVETLQQLIAGLSTNDTKLIQSTLDGFQAANEQISEARAELGGHVNSITRALDSHDVARGESFDAISRIEEADAVKVFSDLSRDQTVFKAAIATSQKLLNEAASDPFLK